MPMPQSSLMTAIVQGGAVLFPSTVVLIPLLLFNMMEPHPDDCFCQTCALNARSYGGALRSQSNAHNILSALIIVQRNLVVLLSVCSHSFLYIGVKIEPAPVPDGFVSLLQYVGCALLFPSKAVMIYLFSYCCCQDCMMTMAPAGHVRCMLAAVRFTCWGITRQM